MARQDVAPSSGTSQSKPAIDRHFYAGRFRPAGCRIPRTGSKPFRGYRSAAFHSPIAGPALAGAAGFRERIIGTPRDFAAALSIVATGSAPTRTESPQRNYILRRGYGWGPSFSAWPGPAAIPERSMLPPPEKARRSYGQYRNRASRSHT